MIYLDTNLLVALCVAEPASARVDAWLARHAEQAIATSAWALTETTSALGIKVRRGDITRETAGSALKLLEVEILPLLALLESPANLFARAELLLRSFDLGLRAADALHLAHIIDGDTVTLATGDAKLHAAARRLGLSAVRVH